MFNVPRAIWKISFLALAVRLIFFAFVLWQGGEPAFLTGDSRGFLRVAENIAAGNGISQSEYAPFLPDSRFPPVFPLLIAGSLVVFGSFLPVIFLNIAIASLIPTIVFALGSRFTSRPGVLVTASALAAFEPLMIIFSVLLIPHPVALMLLLFSCLFFVRFLETQTSADAAFGGLFLGLSVLVRPHGKLLAGFALLFFLVSAFRKIRANEGLRRAFLPAALFFMGFFLILSPWMARNYFYFGTFDISSTGFRNVYTDFAVSVVSYKTRKEYGEVEQELEENFASRHSITTQDIDRDPQWGSALAREGTRILVENPKDTATVFLITLTSFFTQDLYMYFSQWFGLLKSGTIDFSPSVVLVKEGPTKLLGLVWERLGAGIFIPFFGRALWTGIALFSFAGFVIAVWRGGTERLYALFFGFIIAYHAATSMVAAFSAQGFHRYPANVFLFLLSSYAVSHLLSVWFNRRKRADATRAEHISFQP